MSKCAIGVSVVVLAASTASAQWTVISLHPTGGSPPAWSRLDAAGGLAHAGRTMNSGGFWRAGVWNGTAASWIDLHPLAAGAGESIAYGVADGLGGSGQQAGSAQVGGVSGKLHASLWAGTASSWVDLHPAGWVNSVLYATDGVQQVGYADMGGFAHAGLWTGSAGSFIDLNPADAMQSVARAVRNGTQAGFATVFGINRASVWSGTAASWVDLNPAPASGSVGYAIDGGQQAGAATVGNISRASLWSGTKASWVDLNPTGSVESVAFAISGNEQGGYATVGGVPRASVWSGTKASWVDLHAVLPAGFSNSFVTGMSTNGSMLHAAGYGFNTIAARNEALLWTFSLTPLCFADCDQTGTLTIDDFICFQTLYALGDPAADCDASGSLNIDDFICFQTLFAIGC